MISEIQLGNFKAFGPVQTIPLRRITLVFGPNSAGKSSIIQSLMLARHIHDTGNADAHQTTLGGATVDLGGFEKFVHGHRPDRETTIRLTFNRADESKEAGKHESLGIEYSIGKLLASGPSSTPVVGITSATLFLGDQPTRFIRRHDGSLGVDVDAMRRRLEEQRESILKKSKSKGEKVIARHLVGIEELAGAGFQIKLLALQPLNPLPRENVGYHVIEYQKVDRPEPDPPGFFRRLLAAGDEMPDDNKVNALVQRYELECLAESANAEVNLALKAISYLGPLRWIPPRLIPEGEQFDASWQAGGGEAWQRLRREPDLRERVNRFLQDTLQSQHRLKCQLLVPQMDVEKFELNVKQAVERNAAAEERMPESSPIPIRSPKYFQHYLNAKKVESDLFAAIHSELHALNPDDALTVLSIVNADSGLTVSHRDVGTGISQLLPVLVNAAGAKERLIAIEQPELHLHPALQAELGDIFIESALGENKNTFLIETHSEHLILRLLRRVREASANPNMDPKLALRPEDISVLFVRPGKDGSEILNLPVTADGDFACPWPGGFFAERAQELF